MERRRWKCGWILRKFQLVLFRWRRKRGRQKLALNIGLLLANGRVSSGGKRNYFFRISVDDSQWVALKNYFRNPKTKELLNGIFQKLNTEVPEDNWLKIESVKFKLWNNHKNQFEDFIMKPKLLCHLDEKCELSLKEVLDEIKKIIWIVSSLN